VAGESAPNYPDVWVIVQGVLVAFECICFLACTFTLLVEQFEAIGENSTLIETYQRTHGRRAPFFKLFCDVFGPHWWMWLVPLPSGVVPDYEEPAISSDAWDSLVEAEAKVSGTMALGVMDEGNFARIRSVGSSSHPATD